MIVTLKMNIQDQEFNLVVDLTMKAGRIYRQQFSSDLIDDLTDIYQKVNPSIYDHLDLTGIQTEGKTEEEIYNQVIAKAMPVWAEVQKKLALNFEDTERASRIIWAFAKNADNDLPGYEDWIDSFDFVLPVKELITVLYGAWNESAKPIVEVKN